MLELKCKQNAMTSHLEVWLLIHKSGKWCLPQLFEVQSNQNRKKLERACQGLVNKSPPFKNFSIPLVEKFLKVGKSLTIPWHALCFNPTIYFINGKGRCILVTLFGEFINVVTNQMQRTHSILSRIVKFSNWRNWQSVEIIKGINTSSEDSDLWQVFAVPTNCCCLEQHCPSYIVSWPMLKSCRNTSENMACWTIN